MLLTLCTDASPSLSLSDASPSDEEQEQRLFTQPEEINLTVEPDTPKHKATTAGGTNDPKKKKVVTNGKKRHPEISDADLDAQLKQVSADNANDSLLHTATTKDNKAATEDDKTKKGKYFTMPVVGKKSSI